MSKLSVKASIYSKKAPPYIDIDHPLVSALLLLIFILLSQYFLRFLGKHLMRFFSLAFNPPRCRYEVNWMSKQSGMDDWVSHKINLRQRFDINPFTGIERRMVKSPDDAENGNSNSSLSRFFAITMKSSSTKRARIKSDENRSKWKESFSVFVSNLNWRGFHSARAIHYLKVATPAPSASLEFPEFPLFSLFRAETMRLCRVKGERRKVAR